MIRGPRRRLKVSSNEAWIQKQIREGHVEIRLAGLREARGQKQAVRSKKQKSEKQEQPAVLFTKAVNMKIKEERTADTS